MGRPLRSPAPLGFRRLAGRDKPVPDDPSTRICRGGDPCGRPRRWGSDGWRDGTGPSPTIPSTRICRGGDPCGRPRRWGSDGWRDGTGPSPTIRPRGSVVGATLAVARAVGVPSAGGTGQARPLRSVHEDLSWGRPLRSPAPLGFRRLAGRDRPVPDDPSTRICRRGDPCGRPRRWGSVGLAGRDKPVPYGSCRRVAVGACGRLRRLPRICRTPGANARCGEQAILGRRS